MALKKCVACGIEQDESEFTSWWNRETGHRRGTCRTCKKKQQQKWYRKNKETHIANVRVNKEKAIAEARQFAWDYLSSHPCIKCGQSNPVVLEFDHVRGRKKMAVSEMVRAGYSIAAIQKEINKCQVLCANCHREKTSKERGWFSG